MNQIYKTNILQVFYGYFTDVLQLLYIGFTILHLENGRLKYIRDIQRVRQLLNKRIDLHTINEFARMTMNMAANFEYHSKQKENNDNSKQ